MDITPSAQFVACEIPSFDVTILEGHNSEVWTSMFRLYILDRILFLNV